MIKPFRFKDRDKDSYTIIDLDYKFYLPAEEGEGPFSSVRPGRAEGGYYHPAVAVYTGGHGFPAKFTLMGSESEKDIKERFDEVGWLEVLVNTGFTRKQLIRIVKVHSQLTKKQVKDPNHEEVIAEFNWESMNGRGSTWIAEWHEDKSSENTGTK